MNVTTISRFRANAKKFFDDVINNDDILIITRNDGQSLVTMPLEKYNSLTETDYLLSNEANAERLMKSYKNALAGKSKEHELIECDD